MTARFLFVGGTKPASRVVKTGNTVLISTDGNYWKRKFTKLLVGTMGVTTALFVATGFVPSTINFQNTITNAWGTSTMACSSIPSMTAVNDWENKQVTFYTNNYTTKLGMFALDNDRHPTTSATNPQYQVEWLAWDPTTNAVLKSDPRLPASTQIPKQALMMVILANRLGK